MATLQAVKWAPFEVDVIDAIAMLRKASMMASYLPEDSQPIDLSLIATGRVPSPSPPFSSLIILTVVMPLVCGLLLFQTSTLAYLLLHISSSEAAC